VPYAVFIEQILTRSDDGHLDLLRARGGGLTGGLFALFAKPEHPPEGDLTKTETGYQVRLADPLDPAYARDRIDAQLGALNRLADRAAGEIRWAASVDEIEAARRDGVFTMVLHLEGAEAIGPDLADLHRLHAAGLRSLGRSGAGQISSATACRLLIRGRRTPAPA
jgi:membrane dipeptidase